MIESVLESVPWDLSQGPKTGTISTNMGNTNLNGSGTLFTLELNVDDIIFYRDNSNVFRNGQIVSISSDTTANFRTMPPATSSMMEYRAISAPLQKINYFFSDDSKPRCPIVTNAADNDILKTVNGKSKISVNEGVLIKSIYLKFPFNFRPSDSPLNVTVKYYDNTNSFVKVVSKIGEEDGIFSVAKQDQEIIINSYIKPLLPTETDSTWQLGIGISNGTTHYDDVITDTYLTPQVSVVDTPSVLNKTLFPLAIGCRILHADTPLI
jgi:hypothetical protein